ncbi:MAG: cbb3-type cytochrome c oxidase N-terminal domain-containing protein [Spirosomataceae bacterium]
MKKYFLLFISLLSFSALQAQDNKAAFSIESGEQLSLVLLLCVMLAVTMVLFITVIYLYMALKQTLNPKSEAEQSAESELGFWEKILQMRPMSAEARMTLSHSYDGIRELDNPTPPWFMYLFYSTIVFAFVYWIYYHVAGEGDVMNQEYTQELALADEQKAAYEKKFANAINENNVKPLTDAKAIAEGKAVYTQYCVACHGAEGGGGVGPNLTDEYWLHGGSIKDVFHTITEGVPAKGMIAWKAQLKPAQIQQVASFILTLQGTKPAGGKEPQGDKYSPATPTAPADSTGKTVALN